MDQFVCDGTCAGNEFGDCNHGDSNDGLQRPNARTDQDRIQWLRKHHHAIATVLDEAADNLVAVKDKVHGEDRAAILQLARFLEGDAFQPFPDVRLQER